jgi:hypothetical protein
MLDDGKLVDDEELVPLRLPEIYQRHLVAALVAVFLVGYLYLLNQQAVELFVVVQQVGRIDALHLLDGRLLCKRRDMRVDGSDGLPQPPGEDDLAETLPLTGHALRRDVLAVHIRPAMRLQGLDGGLLDDGFCDGFHVLNGCFTIPKQLKFRK